MDPFSASRFGLDAERERLRWSRVRKRKRECEMTLAKKVMVVVNEPALPMVSEFVTVQEPAVVVKHHAHDVRPLHIRLPASLVNKELWSPSVQVVGFSQVRLEASGSTGNLKNLSAFVAIDTEVLMWYSGRSGGGGTGKSYFLFFEVHEFKVYIWGYTRTCRSRADFVERATAVMDSMRGSGEVDGIARFRVVPWLSETQVQSQWGRAIRALSAMVVGPVYSYPWDSVRASLGRTSMPTRKWKWKDFVAAHETGPGKKLKYLTKSSNLSLDTMCRTMVREPVNTISFTTLDQLKKPGGCE